MEAATQPDTTVQNLKSGQEVAKQRLAGRSRSRGEDAKRSLPRTHKDYWKPRLERRSYTRDGARCEVNELSVRIQHLGCRKSFALGTTNADVAATKARDIYVTVLAKGWAAAEAEFNPAMVIRKDDPTIGDFLAEVELKAGLKPKTLRLYSGYLRRIVADAFDLNDGKAKFAPGTEAHKGWQSRVEGIRLAALTPEKVHDWHLLHVKRAGDNPVARQSALRSAASYLRCARSLFSKKWRQQLKLRLPAPLPFEGIKVEKPRPPRYVSTIDPRLLFVAARRELAEADPATYLVTLLALGAGLRKGEIDGLQWSDFDFVNARLTVSTNEFREVKTEDSEATIELDPKLAEEVRSLMPKSNSSFVIPSSRPARPDLDVQYYRAEAVFQRVYAWLRKKGVNGRNPLHTLRKECGSLINQRFGLFAAKTVLRHSSIQTTAASYTALKERVAVPFAELVTKKRPSKRPAVP